MPIITREGKKNSLHFSEIPLPKPLPPKQIGNDNRNLLREWAAVNGAAMRQRTVRQETTMARSGTLPDACYRTDIRIDEKSDPDQIFSETGIVNAKETNEGKDEENLTTSDIAVSPFGKDQTDEYSSESSDMKKNRTVMMIRKKKLL